ncbi:hypothetical protein [Geminicoccus harenae]|uniref:hypothetical protein n=1 Tax=Geminicoccus harenae TaxID=2498453 RepID=UPI00168B7842|nr:hypothetical protein [Geminicoccus harenae]
MMDTITSEPAPRADVSLDFTAALAEGRHRAITLDMAVHGRELVGAGRDQGEAWSLLTHQAIDAMDRLAKLRAEEAGR